MTNLCDRIIYACAASLVAFAAMAQTNHVSWAKIETGPWTMHPVYTEGTGGTVSVSNFLAIADPNFAIGENLIAVWYKREGSNWVTKSWETSNPWEAITAVKIALGISNDEDERWGIWGSSSVSIAESPKEYTAGVLASDPLATLVSSSPNRDVLIELLASMGYKAADLPVEKADGCTTNAKLDGMAAAIAEALIGNQETAVARSMAAWIAAGTAGCGVGSVAVEIVEFPPTPVGPGTWGPPSFSCTNDYVDPGTGLVSWTQCYTWHETRTVTQRRTRARFNPAPPPTYQYCDQTRSGTQAQITQCCTTGVLPITWPPACPPVTPVPAKGAGCATAVMTWIDSNIAWGGWVPPCPF